MKKRLLATLMAAAMAATALAGCGSDGSGTSNGGAEKTDGTEGSATATVDNGETYNIDMQIVTWGNAPDEIDQVEDAINAITEPEIGVTVTLNPIAAWDLINESTRSVTAGEKLDLMCIFAYGQSMDSITTYTSKNMILPLDDLYEKYGTDIGTALDKEIQLGYLGDTLYAIPSKSNYGTGRAFTARKDYLDELGITADPDKIYTVDELTEIFEKFTEKYGTGYYPMALYGGAGGDVYEHFHEIDTLGSQTYNGVLMNAGLDENTTIVDLYETEEYMEYCKQMHQWYQAGYINPDVNTISDDVTAQLKSGKYLGQIGPYYPGSKTGLENNIGVEFEEFKLVEPYATTTAASQALWAIPVTCENPEKTMQFLNLLYQDRELSQDIDSLLAVGLEGVSYNVEEALSGSRAIISATETGTWNTWCPSELYGNYFTTPRMIPNEASIYDDIETFNNNIISENRITDAFGYVFDGSEVSTQMSAVASVATQYRGLVGFGTVDPEEVMPEFIAALKDAGVDDIITENQRQLDAWYANNK